MWLNRNERPARFLRSDLGPIEDGAWDMNALTREIVTPATNWQFNTSLEF
jgi:hypothetical protein